MTTSTGKRDYTKTPKVLEFFNSHIGLVVSTQEIANATGIDVKRIPGACATLMRQGIVESGPSRGLYIARGGVNAKPVKPSDSLYEFVGTAQDGRVIVREADSNILFTLTRL